MSKKNLPADEFFNDIDFPNIVKNIKDISTSDGSINVLLDFERVLDDADLYAYKNWIIGELVDGPDIGRYTVACTFMYPKKLMPDPRGGKRLVRLGCQVRFKKAIIKVPIEIKDAEDYKAGTHYPKMTDKHVWLVNIVMPKDLMNEIREGSIDLAGEQIDLEDLDEAYDEDLDQGTDQEDVEKTDKALGDMGMGGGLPGPAPLPGGPM